MVYSTLITPDGTILRSRHRHDYVIHTDANDDVYMLGGGIDYIRSSLNGDEQYFTLTLDDDHETIRQYVDWGSYGKNGDEPLHYIKVMDMETDHIKAILSTIPHVHPHLKQVMINELEYRNGKTEKGVKVVDYHECPSCGLRITTAQVLSARRNYSCTNCGEHKIRQFKIIYK